MESLPLADLRVFLAIGKHLSFRRAAAELGVSASALSHTLRLLETRLDLRLVNRTTRSVALTGAGQRLYARLSPAFTDIRDALEELNTFRSTPAGRLRINASRLGAKLALLPVVTAFLRTYPDISVSIVIDDGLVDIVAAGFDAGLRLGETLAGDMIATPVGPRQRMALIAAPALFEHYPLPRSPHDLLGLPCIRYQFRSGEIYRWEFERDGAELSLDVQGTLTLGDMDLMIDAAVEGAGIAYVFEGSAQPLLREGKLLRLLEEWCPDFPGFFLYYPNRRRHAAAFQAFLEMLRAQSDLGAHRTADQ